jgi:hypothetical protein
MARQTHAERFVRSFKDRFRRRTGFGERLAHPDLLRALSRKYECRLHRNRIQDLLAHDALTRGADSGFS